MSKIRRIEVRGLCKTAEEACRLNVKPYHVIRKSVRGTACCACKQRRNDNSCKGTFPRDKNGDINITIAGSCALRNEPRPNYLRRVPRPQCCETDGSQGAVALPQQTPTRRSTRKRKVPTGSRSVKTPRTTERRSKGHRDLSPRKRRCRSRRASGQKRGSAPATGVQTKRRRRCC